MFTYCWLVSSPRIIIPSILHHKIDILVSRDQRNFNGIRFIRFMYRLLAIQPWGLGECTVRCWPLAGWHFSHAGSHVLCTLPPERGRHFGALSPFANVWDWPRFHSASFWPLVPAVSLLRMISLFFLRLPFLHLLPQSGLPPPPPPGQHQLLANDLFGRADALFCALAPLAR